MTGALLFFNDGSFQELAISTVVRENETLVTGSSHIQTLCLIGRGDGPFYRLYKREERFGERGAQGRCFREGMRGMDMGAHSRKYLNSDIFDYVFEFFDLRLRSFWRVGNCVIFS